MRDSWHIYWSQIIGKTFVLYGVEGKRCTNFILKGNMQFWTFAVFSILFETYFEIFLYWEICNKKSSVNKKNVMLAPYQYNRTSWADLGHTRYRLLDFPINFEERFPPEFYIIEKKETLTSRLWVGTGKKMCVLKKIVS